MTKTCGSCRYWGVGSTQRDREEDTVYRPCGAVVHDERGYARPEHDDPSADDHDLELTPPEQREQAKRWDAERHAEIAAIRRHLAVVQDGSGYYAALKVREDFGCVLWQKR